MHAREATGATKIFLPCCLCTIRVTRQQNLLLSRQDPSRRLGHCRYLPWRDDMAAVSSSSPSDTLYEDWPRGRIASPDARHDVVLDGPTQPPQPPSTTTTATMQFPPEFQAVLEARQDDYASSSKLQRPMVALEILQAWRSLTPPGRLLRYNTETRLYDDVGDKQAREKIASLLKRQKSVGIHKKREEVGSLQQNAERSSADALP